MRIHDPSFIHLQSVGLLMKGNLIADTMAIMASLDPIMGGSTSELGVRTRGSWWWLDRRVAA
jgi:Ni,Fe-hydrogenase III large subunit